jgi:hypothetical protein
MSEFGTGLGGSSVEIQKGEPPPTNPEFYLKWGEENEKAFIATANAALGQLLTLSTTLVGGTIAFWNYVPIAQNYRFIIVATALFTAMVCLFSAMPSKASFDATSASDVRRHMKSVFAYKTRRLTIAKWALTVTLIFMIAGLTTQAWKGFPNQCDATQQPSPSLQSSDCHKPDAR